MKLPNFLHANFSTFTVSLKLCEHARRPIHIKHKNICIMLLMCVEN